MFDPSFTDRLTLAYMQKTLSQDALRKAEDIGAFDLLKASSLHPEVVTVHGKHGTYMAVRNKKNAGADVEDSNDKKPLSVMDRLKRAQAKKRAQQKVSEDGNAAETAKSEAESKAADTKPKTKTKAAEKAKPKTQTKKKPKPQAETKPKAKAETKAKSKPEPATQPKSKPNKTSVTDEQLGKMMHMLTVNEMKKLIADGKLTLTDKQKAKFDAWTAEQERASKEWERKAEEDRMHKRFGSSKISASYRKALRSRFENADEDVQRAFDIYAKELDGCVETAKSKRSDFSLSTGKIRLDGAQDVKGYFKCQETAGMAAFHELGHLIDNNAKKKHSELGGSRTVSADPQFLEALRADVKAAEKAMHEQAKAEGYKKIKIDDVRRKIVQQMITDAAPDNSQQGRIVGAAITGGLQDIFGGVLQRPYPGCTAKHSGSYWKCNDRWMPGMDMDIHELRDELLGTEAFANMYAACTDPKHAEIMKKWLPNSFRRFRQILSEVANG